MDDLDKKSPRKSFDGISQSPNHNDQLIQPGLPIKGFNYLISKHDSDSFTFTNESIKEPLSNLSQYKNAYSLFVFTYISEDTLSESNSLNQTLISIASNVNSLSRVNISVSNILYILFFKNIHNKETNDLFFKQSESEPLSSLPSDNVDAFKASFMEYNGGSTSSEPMQLLIIHKPNANVSYIESLELFYIDILNQLKSKETLVNVLQISNGVIIPDSCISNMISMSNSRSIAIVPFTETIPNGLYSTIEHYANFQFNIYDLFNYYFSCCIPLNHKVYLIRVNSPILENIKLYFTTKISLDSSVYYHDFLFSIFLTNQGYQVALDKDIICHYSRNQITFDQMMQEYTDKQSGIYASILDISKYWIDCSSIDQNCLSKTGLLFLLIGFIFDFCFPSMMSIVIYSIIKEAFNAISDTGAKFFTSVYLILTCISIAFSLIRKGNDSINRSQDSYRINFYLYCAFSIFYYFILICSVPAMHYININKTQDTYTFDFAALGTLIVLNVIVGIVPLSMNLLAFFCNIVSSLLYLAIGAPGYTSLFLNYSIIGSTVHIGTVKVRNGTKDFEREQTMKGILIVIYFVLNGIFLCVLFGLNTRAERANGVLALAIIYTIYNIIKMCSIIFGVCKKTAKGHIKEEGELGSKEMLDKQRQMNEISPKDGINYNEYDNKSNDYPEDSNSNSNKILKGLSDNTNYNYNNYDNNNSNIPVAISVKEIESPNKDSHNEPKYVVDNGSIEIKFNDVTIDNNQYGN